ncbi:MAG: hypothetical protein M1816_001824 [Peltula sp. TS41687]|nr:MAG: hypothetical protein M1816_001824 [Peltula sp. TS41687]
MRLLHNSLIASCFVTAMAVPLPDGTGKAQDDTQQQVTQKGQQSHQIHNPPSQSDNLGIGKTIITHVGAATGGAALRGWILSFKKHAAANTVGRTSSARDEAGNPRNEEGSGRYTEQELADRASEADVLTCVADCIARRRYALNLDNQSPLMRFDSYAYLVFGRSCLESCVLEADEKAAEADGPRLPRAPWTKDVDDPEASTFWGFKDANPSLWGSNVKKWGKEAVSRVGAGLMRAADTLGKTGAVGGVSAPVIPAYKIPGILVP